MTLSISKCQSCVQASAQNAQTKKLKTKGISRWMLTSNNIDKAHNSWSWGSSIGKLHNWLTTISTMKMNLNTSDSSKKSKYNNNKNKGSLTIPQMLITKNQHLLQLTNKSIMKHSSYMPKIWLTKCFAKLKILI